MNPLAGTATALGSSAAFGTSDFLGGVLSKRHAPIVVVAWSHACTLLLLLVAGAVVGPPSSWAWLPWAVGAGLAGALGLVTFYHALATGTVGVVSPIAALGVIIPVTLAILGGERPSGLQVVGIVAAIAGALLASGPELRHEERHRARAVGWAALAALGFGVTVVAIVHGAASSTLYTMLGMRGTSTLGFALLALLRRTVGGVRARDVAAFAGVGVLDLLGNVLLAVASTLGLVSVNVVLSSLYPVITVALAAVLLHERLHRVQWLGVALALAGVVVLNLPR